MSLVGTRPPTVDEYEQYEFVHRKRLAVKPGITGMWQVSGRSRITDFDKVVALDAAYIEQWDIYFVVIGIAMIFGNTFLNEMGMFRLSFRRRTGNIR